MTGSGRSDALQFPKLVGAGDTVTVAPARISCTSSPGQGTQFHVVLPLNRDSTGTGEHAFASR